MQGKAAKDQIACAGRTSRHVASGGNGNRAGHRAGSRQRRTRSNRNRAACGKRTVHSEGSCQDRGHPGVGVGATEGQRSRAEFCQRKRAGAAVIAIHEQAVEGARRIGGANREGRRRGAVVDHLTDDRGVRVARKAVERGGIAVEVECSRLGRAARKDQVASARSACENIGDTLANGAATDGGVSRITRCAVQYQESIPGEGQAEAARNRRIERDRAASSVLIVSVERGARGRQRNLDARTDGEFVVKWLQRARSPIKERRRAGGGGECARRVRRSSGCGGRTPKVTIALARGDVVHQ